MTFVAVTSAILYPAVSTSQSEGMQRYIASVVTVHDY